MAYTDWCEIAGMNCPGGTEECPLPQTPTDPEVCLALDGIPGEPIDPETPPPGGPY